MRLAPLRAAVFAATVLAGSAASAQTRRTINPRAWLTEAARLETRARTANDPDRIRAEMLRHALTLEPSLRRICTDRDDADLDIPGAGWINVYALGHDERLVTIACNSGAVLGNLIVVPYYVRVGARATIRRSSVREWTHGHVTREATASGSPSFDASARTLTMENRCCAGMEGTTRVYRVTASGDLTLLSIAEWTRDDAGRERRRVIYPVAR